jgi:RNA-directed DNA polymerase
MSTTVPSVYEWNALPWRRLERDVYKLQKRIFQASRRGDSKTVHRLQRLLLKSWAARCLAVRKVTQDNRGKKTAGVDGVKSLTPPQRLQLAQELALTTKAKPVRRVWIPKPGTREKRGLGIPTLRNRAEQTLVRLALEPEWEAHFEPNSYGFRPGRSCHDAIEVIFHDICRKPKYVLDADIAACFDRLDQSALVRKLHPFPALRRVIQGWLKAGVWDGVDFKPTETGAQQGSPLSPLLANVALHGLETDVQAAFPRTYTSQGQVHKHWKPTVVRFADDFVVLHENREVIEQVQQLISDWLAGIGLELKAEKTRICHTLDPHEGIEVGFDFLGFEVRQYRVGYHRSGRSHKGYKTIIKPSKAAQKRHIKETGQIVQRYRTAPQEALIAALNPVITGWSRYYSTVISRGVCQDGDPAPQSTATLEQAPAPAQVGPLDRAAVLAHRKAAPLGLWPHRRNPPPPTRGNAHQTAREGPERRQPLRWPSPVLGQSSGPPSRATGEQSRSAQAAGRAVRPLRTALHHHGRRDRKRPSPPTSQWGDRWRREPSVASWALPRSEDGEGAIPPQTEVPMTRAIHRGAV